MKDHLYEQIYNSLLNKIQKGLYKYGDYLPTEKQLCEEYDVSLMTVRTALDKLKDSGMIIKVKGKCSMVTARVRQSALSNKKIVMLLISFPFLMRSVYPRVDFPKDLFTDENSWCSIMFSSMFQNIPPDYSALFAIYDYDTIINAYDTTILQSADRIIILGYYDKNMVDFLHKKNKLVVVYNCNDKTIDASSVISNDRIAFKNACDYLFSLGHKNIAAIFGDPMGDSCERAMGYQDSMIQNGIIAAEYIKWGNSSFESGYFLANELLDTVPDLTAIVCANDNVAMGALYAIEERGLRCPEDISIIGHDNNSFANEKKTDFLTTIDPHFEQMGKMFAQMISRSIWVEKLSVCQSELVLRKSVAPPRTETNPDI